jgi:hypothetical protein
VIRLDFSSRDNFNIEMNIIAIKAPRNFFFRKFCKEERFVVPLLRLVCILFTVGKRRYCFLSVCVVSLMNIPPLVCFLYCLNQRELCAVKFDFRRSVGCTI